VGHTINGQDATFDRAPEAFRCADQTCRACDLVLSQGHSSQQQDAGSQQVGAPNVGSFDYSVPKSRGGAFQAALSQRRRSKAGETHRSQPFYGQGLRDWVWGTDPAHQRECPLVTLLGLGVFAIQLGDVAEPVQTPRDVLVLFQSLEQGSRFAKASLGGPRKG